MTVVDKNEEIRGLGGRKGVAVGETNPLPRITQLTLPPSRYKKICHASAPAGRSSFKMGNASRAPNSFGSTDIPYTANHSQPPLVKTGDPESSES